MVNKVLFSAALADALFMGSGILELTFSLVVQKDMNSDPSDGRQALRNVVYQRMPLNAGIVNAGFILAAFVATIPGLLMQSTRGWVKLAGYLVTFCAVFTMCVGVYLWVMTMRIGQDFFSVYMDLEPEVQGLIQTSVCALTPLERQLKRICWRGNTDDDYLQFECCGYFNSTSPAFVTNPTCPSPAAATLLRGCQKSIANFANLLLDEIFTALFGVVGKSGVFSVLGFQRYADHHHPGVDAFFVLALACLSKDRKDREWYRRVDRKKSYW